tara:strand:+ start:2594 stop:2809 length:216 start_codon:yes stop_codon:yes gene_type:complete
VDYHNNLTLSQHFHIFWEKSGVATQLILLYILRKKGRKQEKLGNCVGNMKVYERLRTYILNIFPTLLEGKL